MAEFEGKTVLFAADAHPGLLVENLNRFKVDAPVEVDLFKVSHHGSSHNTSPALLEKVVAPRYLFSTNGSIFKHPKAVTVARIIKNAEQPELIFNYRREMTNEIWDLSLLKDQHGYSTIYPADGEEGVTIEL